MIKTVKIILITSLIVSGLNYLLLHLIRNTNIHFNTNILFTIFNLLLTVLASYSSYKSYKYQKKEFEESNRLHLTNQAQKIYTLMVQKYVEAPSYIYKSNNSYYQPILIGNSSNEPIYKVFIISTYSGATLESLVKNSMKFDKYIYIRILVSGKIYKVIDTDGMATGGARAEAIIFFNDSRGNKWVRDPQGNLKRLDDDFDVCKEFGIETPITYDHEESIESYNSLEELYKHNPKINS